MPGGHETLRTFGAPYDALVAVLTLVFVALIAGVGVVAALTGGIGPLISLACALLLFGCWAFAPKGYVVAPGELVVVRPAGELHLSLDGMQAAGRSKFSRRIRILGYRNGGVFGVYGRLYAPRDGWMWFWGRRIGNVVALQFDRRVVLVMPDDPDAFVGAINDATRSTAS